MSAVLQRAAVTEPIAGIDAENPWPGLEAFDEAAQRFFNGRAKETAELRRLVLTAPLTVVFGASGLGKSSLLRAGLFPQLRSDDLLPVYVRLDFASRGEPLIRQLEAAMLAQFREHRVDATPIEPGMSLWEWLHLETLEIWSRRNRPLLPLFVLDQFEEVFTLGEGHAEAVARLRRDLGDLVENRIPDDVGERLRAGDESAARLALGDCRYKLLLSFREDFLPAVEGWKREIPSIMSNRLRLLPMSLAQAFQAVHDTAPHLVDEATADAIVRFVADSQKDAATSLRGNEVGDASAWVEPALLSLVCRGLNEQRKSKGKPSIDLELVQSTGKTIVSDYYLSAIAGVSKKARNFVEEELITERGFRKPCDLEDASAVHGVPAEELQLLIDRRLLRKEAQRQTATIELTHDLLTSVVRKHRNARREHRKVQRLRVFGGLVALAAVAAGWINWQIQENNAQVRASNEARERVLEESAREVQAAQDIADERARQVADLERQNDEVTRRLEELLREIGRLPPTGAPGPMPDRTRAVYAQLDSLQRELGAVSATADAEDARQLASQFNDPSEQVRKSAVAQLTRDDSANPQAVRSVLETLSAENLPELSAAGRINALYFLTRADPAAWTAENVALADAAIARIRGRSTQGIAIGSQTSAELDRLEKMLGSVRP